MLDALVLKRLTKTGVIAYFVGQVVLFAIWGFYVFGIKDSSLDEGEMAFIIGMVIIALIWAGVCLMVWKKPKETEDSLNTKETKS
jgi:hypothetical protein